MNIFDILKFKMKHGTEVQKVTSDNMSRAHIPGEFATVVEKFTMSNLKQNNIKLSTTNANHMHGSISTSENLFKVRTNRNQKVIDYSEQMAEADSNQINYNTVLLAYNKLTNMLRQAIGDKR